MRPIAIPSLLWVMLLTAEASVQTTSSKVPLAVPSTTVSALPMIPTQPPSPTCLNYLNNMNPYNSTLESCAGPFPNGITSVTNSFPYLETTLDSCCPPKSLCSAQQISSVIQGITSNCPGNLSAPEIVAAAERIYKSNFVPLAWCLQDSTGHYCMLKDGFSTNFANINMSDPTVVCTDCFINGLQLAAKYLTINPPWQYAIVNQSLNRTVVDVYGKPYYGALLTCGTNFVSDLIKPLELVAQLRMTEKNSLTTVTAAVPGAAVSGPSSLVLTSDAGAPTGRTHSALLRTALCAIVIALALII